VPAKSFKYGDLKSPRLVSSVLPVYPPEAKREGVAGAVIISAWYGGVVASVRSVDDDADQVQDALRA
jgi:hypothetical protein